MLHRRIGIYAGTFNPVHAGHITFALQSVQAANLDAVYFLPERQPRHKKGVEHMGHRLGMLEKATQPYALFNTLEFPDVNFSVQRTLPRLRALFPHEQLVFMFGSDVAPHIPEWRYAKALLTDAELIIGLREPDTQANIEAMVEGWAVKPKAITSFASYAPHISSSRVREALRTRTNTDGLLSSVARYSDRHWLYVSLSQ